MIGFPKCRPARLAHAVVSYREGLLAIALFTLSACVGSPLATRDQTPQELANDIAGYEKGRLCAAILGVEEGHCAADFEFTGVGYPGYCAKISEAATIVLTRRGETCPVTTGNDGDISVAGTTPTDDANLVLSVPSQHWTVEVIEQLAVYEELPSAEELSWKTFELPQQGRYETEIEYRERISASLDSTANLYYVISPLISVVSGRVDMNDYVMFEYSPFEPYLIGEDLERSIYAGQNALGATATVSRTEGVRTVLSPVKNLPRWRKLNAMTNGWEGPSFYQETHENIPLFRDDLLPTNSEVVSIRIFSVQPNSPFTYGYSVDRVVPEFRSPVEVDIGVREIKGTLEYTGFFDKTRGVLIAVFSRDLEKMYFLERDIEVDLTAIASDRQ